METNCSERLDAALAAHRSGDLRRAEQLYQIILACNNRHFDALHLLGVINAQRGDFGKAVALINEALQIRPNDQEAIYNLGNALLSLNRPLEALKCFDRVVAIVPTHADAHSSRGNALSELDRLEEALESCDKAVEIHPGHAIAHNNRGNLLRNLNRPGEALDAFETALAVNPNYADAVNNRGCVLQDMGRLEEAADCFDKALKIRPDYFEAHNNKGNVAQEIYHFEEALACYDRALRICPAYSVAHNNRGNVLRRLGRYEEALASFDRAIKLEPDNPDALFNRAGTYQDVGLLDNAIADFERSLDRDNDNWRTRGMCYAAKRHACDWRNYEEDTSLILSETRRHGACVPPWVFLAMSNSPSDQFECVRNWQRDKYPISNSPLWKGERYNHDRIRVAYVSADFHEHPMAWLMTALFEQHDRSKFEIIALSFDRAKNNPIRDRLVNAFDHFLDVYQKSPREIAELIRDMEIDIAIDRKGYTHNCRPEIFALRPAPIQVNYLAYPGTMGSEYIDYIIADRFVIPPEHRQYYSEAVVYLPESYQPNDSQRFISESIPDRAEVGLPERGFVFACFNNSYKIVPPMFDIWMRLLAEVEDSVLWLLEANAAASRNLRQEAESRGIAPERLIFAKFLPHHEHLARLRLADLFLDTLPFNAHTTTSDALWAGLPVLTCLGNTFAGRVAGGLLNAVGLPELITYSLDDYTETALNLARDSDRLTELRSRLARNRLTHPLFDTDRYRRSLETAYETMWSRYQRGERPACLSVSIDQGDTRPG
ncbi:MAG: tetratricopeptide repeat protein [Alphaproteobacteria bacterium]|nr:tetratricopeptide repeat protein [Alphaproteobacteria bacterium]